MGPVVRPKDGVYIVDTVSGGCSTGLWLLSGNSAHTTSCTSLFYVT